MIKWNKDLIAYRLSRADETLKDARVLAKSGRWDACVNRLYYACFYAVTALLMLDGLSSSKHSGIRSLFNKHFVKSEKVPKKLAAIYNDLFERRQEVDYIDFINFSEEQVMPWISKAEEFINFISGLIKDNE
ncbi:MAG: HEPN domain-containing protein [Ignavibacteriaceae bacterium]|nr:HEPN domain-containing protein [Ignavibacteriaceae bacterium]